MHGKASPRSMRGVQRAVLALVLAAQPKTLTIPELARGFDAGDAQRAVRELVCVGLLECSGVRPTDAALRFDWLELP
jgi:hypothetical protein